VTTGVLAMAYGTPRTPADIEAYYTHIRRGRPPTLELLADLTARYEAIGGTSPLAVRTETQTTALQRALDDIAPSRFRVAVGYKHEPPFIEDTVDALAAEGVDRMVALVLAPHYSALSVGEYLSRARERGAIHGIDVDIVESWHLEPAYVEFLADAVRTALGRLPDRTKVLFTAHSLPSRILGLGDPYPEQLRATANAVADRVGLVPWTGWAVCWQSAGRTPEPWLGPDVLDVIRDLAAHGSRGVLVCPCGFVSDHLEVLYDLDVEARRVAKEMGLAFERTAVPNDDPSVMASLAGRIVAATAVAARG